jgi:hypothetical protein
MTQTATGRATLGDMRTTKRDAPGARGLARRAATSASIVANAADARLYTEHRPLGRPMTEQRRTLRDPIKIRSVEQGILKELRVRATPLRPSDLIELPTAFARATSSERRRALWNLIDRGQVVLTANRRLKLASSINSK